MTLTKQNAASAARRRQPWPGIAAGVAAGFLLGLLSAQSFSHPSNAPPLAVRTAKQDQIAAELATFPIVPSPVIEPHPVFFYGTGDGNGGYLPDR